MAVDTREPCGLELIAAGPTEDGRKRFEPLHRGGHGILLSEQSQRVVGDGQVAAVGNPRILHAEHRAAELITIRVKAPLRRLVARIEQ